MKTDTPSLETPQAARLRRRQLIRQLLERDKTPLAILFMAAVVGTLVGLAAVAFDKGVAWLQNQRMGALVHTADNYPLLLTVAFLCSAVLAMFGYFLVRKYAPEAGGSGIDPGGAAVNLYRRAIFYLFVEKAEPLIFPYNGPVRLDG